MQQRVITLSVLGLAHGHLHGYLQRWLKTPELRIRPHSAWDHDAARLTAGCERHGLTPCASVEELLQDPAVDAVMIGAETAYHAELVEVAAAAGKAIILQKPLALTLDQADRIVNAVSASGVPFTMAWQMRVDPQNVQMRDWVRSGELGRVFMLRRRHGLATHNWPGFGQTWHTNPELNRDIWADDAAHPFDFMLWMLGLPETVTAEIASLHDPDVPHDNGVAILRWPSGAVGEVSCSFTAWAGENTTEIYAEHGAVVQNYGDAISAAVPRDPGAEGLRRFDPAAGKWVGSGIATPTNHFERIEALAAPLAAFLHGEAPPLASASDGRDALKLVLASLLSSRSGTRVSLNDPRLRAI